MGARNSRRRLGWCTFAILLGVIGLTPVIFDGARAVAQEEDEDPWRGGVGTFDGRVVDVDGNGIAGAKLYFPRIDIRFNAGDTGRFRIVSIPSGFHPLVVTHPDYPDLPLEIEIPKGGTLEREIRLSREPKPEDKPIVVTGSLGEGESSADRPTSERDQTPYEGPGTDPFDSAKGATVPPVNPGETTESSKPTPDVPIATDDSTTDDATVGTPDPTPDVSAEPPLPRPTRTTALALRGRSFTETDVAAHLRRTLGLSPSIDVDFGRSALPRVRGFAPRDSFGGFPGTPIFEDRGRHRVHPLERMPTDLIDAVEVDRFYSPEYSGEFIASRIDILPRALPREAFFRVSAEAAYRDNTTFRDFRTYDGSDGDRFTYDRGSREVPSTVPGAAIPTDPLFDTLVQNIGRSFRNEWSPQRESAPIDHSLSAHFGRTFDLGSLGELGVVGKGAWSNEYRAQEDQTFRALESATTGRSNFTLDQSRMVAELDALVQLTYRPSVGQIFGARQSLVRHAEDRVQEQLGTGDADPGTQLAITQLRWVESFQHESRFFGEHRFGEASTLRWNAGLTKAEEDEPDRRQVRYSDAGGDFALEDVVDSGVREYYFLEDDGTSLAADLTIPFRLFDGFDEGFVPGDHLLDDPAQRLVFGFAYDSVDREFDARRLRFDPQPGAVDVDGDPIDLENNPEGIFTSDNINPNGIVLTEVTENTDFYDGERSVFSAFATADVRLGSRVRVEGGLRFERFEQEVDTRPRFGGAIVARGDLDDDDWFPAARVIIDLEPRGQFDGQQDGRRSQLTFSAAQSAQRPTLRQLSTFGYTDIAEGYTERGNPTLARSLVQHFDAAWDLVLSSDERVGVSLFAKRFDDPIQPVIAPQVGSLLATWENGDEGQLFGFDVVVQKRLDFLGFEKLRVSAALTLTDSDVDADPNNTTGAFTDSSHELAGLPDWLFELGFIYDDPDRGCSAGLLLTSTGEALHRVGALGAPNEMLQPRHQLDAFWRAALGPTTTLTVSVENILDEPFDIEQGGVTVRRSEIGARVGVTLGIEF